MPDGWNEAMLDGAFERAWVISDRVMRERVGCSCADLPHHLRWVWDGAPLADRTVLVRCYHGLGDTLQFMRFVPRVAAVARAVIVEAQEPLLPLLRSVCGPAALYPLDAELPDWNVAIESMELPHALRITLADLPGPIPYLAAPLSGSMAMAPRPRTGPERLRVGLVWAAGDWRRERSLSPELLLPLARLPIDLVGLQLGPARRDPAASGLVGSFAADIAAESTIVETAALICDLDLVVTVDTMVAHLAGALGRPVWTLLDAGADWRWMRRRSASPWYPTMRLFRQAAPGGWDPVVDQVTAALATASRWRGAEQDLLPSR
jgi:Glycosyltransferase family 9 (heptosyltransferase)